MKTKSLFLTLVLLALGGSLSAQKLTGSPGTLVGGDMNASSAACATARSCVWATLSPNASSLSVTLSGTWSATVLAEQSADGGTTWTTVAGSLANGLTTYTVTSMTDFRVRVSAYTSGIASVTLSVGLLQVQSVVPGPGSSSSSLSPGFAPGILESNYTPVAGHLLWTCTWPTTAIVTCVNQTTALSGAVNGSNVATLNVQSTTGWAIGNTIVVSGFSGGDSFYNGTFTITAVTASSATVAGSVSYALVHATAASTTLGQVQNNSVGPFTSANTSPASTIVAFATTLGPSGFTTFNGAVLACPRTTILSMQSSTQVTLNNACTIANATVGNNPFFFGPSETAGLQAFSAAVNAACGTGVWASGYALTSEPLFFNPPTSCATPIGGVRLGPDLIGNGPGESQIVIDPNFVWADCVGGTSGHSCFFGAVGAGSSGGYGVQDLGITGLGVSNYTVATQTFITELQSNTYARNVNITGIGANTQNLVCMRLSGLPLVIGPNVQCDGAGAEALIAGGGNAGAPQVCLGESFFGDVAGSNASLAANEVTGGYFISNGCQFGPAYSNSRYTMLVSGAGAVWRSTNDGFILIGTTGMIPIGITAASEVDLSQMDLTAGSNTATGVAASASGAVVHLSQTKLKLTGTSANGLSSVAGATIFDDGGNTIASTQNNMVAGTFIPWKSVSGTCTGVGTAASTLALRISGTSTTGTGIPTTCTSTTLDAGNVMDHAGKVFILQVSATAAGTNASSGVVTVLKNGGATTVTCTIGTGTTCIDNLHSATFVAGDLISLQFTTQAADTLAGVKANVSAY